MPPPDISIRIRSRRPQPLQRAEGQHGLLRRHEISFRVRQQVRIAPVRLPEFCKACFGVHAAEFLLRIDAERSQRKEDLRAALGARLAP